MKTAGWTLRPPFSPLCPPTAWMLSAKVWMWTWPTRNGLIALTRQVMCTHWSGSCCFNRGNGRVHHLVYNTFTQIYIYHKLLYALCKNLKCSHKRCCNCTGFFFHSHKPAAYISVSFCLILFQQLYKMISARLPQHGSCAMHFWAQTPAGIDLSPATYRANAL